MKIVFLDSYACNPGDMDWGPIRRLGDLQVYDRTRPEDVVTRSEGADVLGVNKVLLSREVLERLPLLKFITLFSTGVNVVDLSCARERGIPVSNIPSYSTASVTESAIGHLLNLSARIAESAHSVRAGDWCRSEDFCYWHGPLRELSGRTLGVVGFGTIGRRVALVAQALGMNVLAYGPHLVPGDQVAGVKASSLAEIFSKSDAVTLHCPLTAENKGFVNQSLLSTMKRGAFLINTSRGGLLDELAVSEALKSGQLGGFGADVLSTEPPSEDNPLLSSPNAWITPHTAWATDAARRRLLETVYANIDCFCQGKPQNVVNGM